MHRSCILWCANSKYHPPPLSDSHDHRHRRCQLVSSCAHWSILYFAFVPLYCFVSLYLSLDLVRLFSYYFVHCSTAAHVRSIDQMTFMEAMGLFNGFIDHFIFFVVVKSVMHLTASTKTNIRFLCVFTTIADLPGARRLSKDVLALHRRSLALDLSALYQEIAESKIGSFISLISCNCFFTLSSVYRVCQKEVPPFIFCSYLVNHSTKLHEI
jgi:hypothetical protein